MNYTPAQNAILRSAFTQIEALKTLVAQAFPQAPTPPKNTPVTPPKAPPAAQTLAALTNVLAANKPPPQAPSKPKTWAPQAPSKPKKTWARRKAPIAAVTIRDGYNPPLHFFTQQEAAKWLGVSKSKLTDFKHKRCGHYRLAQFTLEFSNSEEYIKIERTNK